MRQLILILGGARSGKSRHAQELAWELAADDVLYVATAEPLDDEMQQRITNHRAERPATWQTLESPCDLASAMQSSPSKALILIDCVTLLVSNILMRHLEDEDAFCQAVDDEIAALLAHHQQGHATWVVVSNELGLGLVPDNRLGRIYRDVLGRANQQLAAQADTVLFMVAGIPMTVKDG